LHVNDSRPGETHKAFCELPFDLICTTNFEFLLERGYELVSRYCRPVVEEDQLAIGNANHAVSLLKFHGDLHHPNRLIVTEEDYDGFIDQNPMFATFLANILITKTALFIGYSLDDSDFRQIWQLIKNRLGSLRRQAYTLSIDCSSHEIARYERRGIKVINIHGKKADYPKILTEIFKELKEYWSKELFKHSTVTDEDRLIQLSLPPEPNNRLCFFSIPFKLLSFYKKYVFPVVQEYGFVPITADEVLSAGDSILAKISALIDRAGIIIADISSSFVQFELGMAVAASSKRILIIKEKDTPIASDLAGILYIEREKDPFKDLDLFLSSLKEFFVSLSTELESDFENEATRLLEKKEYRAAVVSAMIILENSLRTALPKFDDLPQFKYSMGQLLQHAIKRQVIPEVAYSEIKEYVRIRNQLVHTDERIHPQTAKKIVKAVLELIEKIEEFHRIIA